MSDLKTVSDEQVKAWLDQNVYARKLVASLCSINGRRVAFSEGVENSILVFDTGDFLRLSKLVNDSKFDLNYDKGAALAYTASFKYAGIEIITYGNTKKEFDYE